MDIKESVAKLFSGGVLVSLIEFGAIAVFTQILGAGAVGSFFVFRAVVGMVGVPVDLGISRAVEKHLSADDPPGEVIGTAIVVKTLLALPWLIALVIARPHVEEYIGIAGVLPVVILGLVASQAKKLSLRMLAGQLRVGQNALLKVLGRSVWAITGFALIYAGWDAIAIIASFVLGSVVTVLGALVRLDLAIGWPRVQRARELVNFGRYVVIGSVGSLVYQWMDVAILRLFVPTSVIGAYEIAWRIASVSLMVTQAIRATLFPQISRWHAEGQLHKIESAFYTWLQVPLYLTIPAFAGAIVLGKAVLGTLFGPEVTIAYPVLLIFMVEKIIRSVQLIIGPSLFAMNKPHLGYRGSAVAIVVNLVLNVTLIPEFGMIGAAIATSLGAMSAASISTMYVTRSVKVQVPWARIAWSVASATIMAVGVFVIRPYLPDGWIRLAVGVGAGVLFYALLLSANEGIRIELRGAIREVRGMAA